MCKDHDLSEMILKKTIKVKDISDAVLDMPEPRGFILSDIENGVRPRYAKSIESLYLLMHWPFISESGSKVDDSTKTSQSGISVYAAIMQHGKTHVAEVFFADEKACNYIGSHKSFSVDFPDNIYHQGYDEWLMNELAEKVLGVRREQVLTQEMVNEEC